MAAPSSGVGGLQWKMERAESGEQLLPGFKDADSFVKHSLGAVVAATKASTGLPQCGDEYDFYRSFPGFRAFCDMQGERLLHSMSRIMQYHGCRSHIKDSSKVTELEDKFDLLIDSNDVILERVGILLDEASGVNRNQQPILPAGLQPPKTIISSWNRKGGDSNRRTKSETFRLLHAKNILRPQLKFREKIDNSNTPFVPKLFIKPNAQKPLPPVLANRKYRQEHPKDLDVPRGLADFIHQQRTQQDQQDMCAHPYQYELDCFIPPEAVLQKPQVQMFLPLQETPCHFVSSLDELVELNEKLCKCPEFAIDVEHHSYRSFLGLTCLMQVSTRTEDFIIDTLELRSDMYILNECFTDPNVVKVLHGADSDIEWLQKDFGLYLVNLFDTHQAARALNLGRHSLDHLLKLYCGVESDKRYQLADWRIRPLPEEMVAYARSDTHFLLYIYDKMRVALLEEGKGQTNLLQMVWQKSRDICLKKYIKPIFTEDSYLELSRKHKKHFNTQQLAASRLLYAWRDKMARQEDESLGYVLPNHMLLKVVEELPKEPQGIIACCNPIPPLVRQQLNELHLLIQQAREVPLLKSETPARAKKKRRQISERTENLLFGPHDSSHTTLEGAQCVSSTALAMELKQGSLFHEGEKEVDRKAQEFPDSSHLVARASISLFNDPETENGEEKNLTVAQQRARRIMESFENPFRMYLSSEENNTHISQAAKSDPSTKIYEISNRWKLLSQVQVQKKVKEKEEAKQLKHQQKVARKQAWEKLRATADSVTTIRQQAEEESARRRMTSNLRREIPKLGKKRTSQQQLEEQATQKQFTPYDYSKSDFKMFAGASKAKQSQFDPNQQTATNKKVSSSKKLHPSAGNKSMSFLTEKSSRGFKHSWPKR
ncbi:exosome complex component 10 [Microcaecilia unicolor]|uniref:Exosome complex component 10 n=1 Tax=Microcaecilia unicolor TaxID=1415580 RepID=A0A6P7ZYI1_9AMPH|nr:exosome component 10 [Microcaecilia unicolor]